MFSYSRVETFNNCPRQYKFRYIDKIETLSNQDADNALVCGTALHTGIETTVENGLKMYADHFFCLTDKHVEEMIKLEYMIPLAKKFLPEGGEFEYKIQFGDFIGFIDYLVPLNEEKTEFAIYDFKYSNAVDRYMQKSQLLVYKYFFELMNPGKSVKALYFFFVPKVAIRQKKTETFEEFRVRLRNELEAIEEVQIKRVNNSPEKLGEFLNDVEQMKHAEDFPKNETKLCNWCEYQEYCTEGETYMLLPKNERRTLDSVKKRTIWIYGKPFSGKTFFADAFPDPLMLNTDGNIKNVTAPYLTISDVVTQNGRITERKLAWEVFKEAITELEKGSTFKTIVIDLLEDLYESCRLYKYAEMGISHESDSPFKAWDIIRTEFLSVIRRVVNLDYENIIFCSHEDSSKDITKRHGDKITSIRPNLTDKCANKVAGMVDVVARVVANDDERILSFKNDEVIFGGGRFTFSKTEIPLNYETFCAEYDAAKKGTVKVVEKKESEKKVDEKSEPETKEADPEVKPEPEKVENPRVRKPRTKPADPEVESVDLEPPFNVEEPESDTGSSLTESAAIQDEVDGAVLETEDAPRRRRRRSVEE